MEEKNNCLLHLYKVNLKPIIYILLLSKIHKATRLYTIQMSAVRRLNCLGSHDITTLIILHITTLSVKFGVYQKKAYIHFNV